MARVICQGCGQEIPTWTGRCPSCGATEIIRIDARADKLINRVVSGRYKILKKLGQGGMGSVYMGELVGIGQRVALKFLNSNLSQDPELARRFLNEAKSYARVSHPHAVVLHDFGQDEEGTLYISMELVDGVDLQKFLADLGRLAVSDAVEIVLQVADVLGYAHSKGVIHRDLKPENIMVRRGTRGLHTKVLDFGIARLVEEGITRLTAQGSVAGTPRYMAPEQAEGHEVDARVDIYALGLVFFELLTGIQPFDAPSVTESLRKQLVVPMPHIKDVAPDLELDDLDAVIQKATAKDRDQRYATMEEFTVSLSQAAHLQSSRPTVTSAPKEGEKTVLRQQEAGFPKTAWPKVPHPGSLPASKLIWLGGAVALVAVVGAVYGLKQSSNKSPPVEKPITPPLTIEKSTTAVETAPPPKQMVDNPGPKDIPKDLPADIQYRQRFLTSEILIKAKAEIASGNFNAAKQILGDIQPEDVSKEDVVKLKSSLNDLTSQLGRARALAAQGECEAAIKEYDRIIKAYPDLKVAKDERAKCRKMLPPTDIE